jgi:hypothetical protein
MLDVRHARMHSNADWTALPLDVQLAILGHPPLAELANPQLMGLLILDVGHAGINPGTSWNDLHLDAQLAVLTHLPLAELARQATVSKSMRAGYKERLKERQACIDARLAQGWPVEVTRRLSAYRTAVPRDLIDTPAVRHFLVICLLPPVFQHFSEDSISLYLGIIKKGTWFKGGWWWLLPKGALMMAPLILVMFPNMSHAMWVLHK